MNEELIALLTKENQLRINGKINDSDFFQALYSVY